MEVFGAIRLLTVLIDGRVLQRCDRSRQHPPGLEQVGRVWGSLEHRHTSDSIGRVGLGAAGY